MHHVAWASSQQEHAAWRERIVAGGGRPTPIIERFYFKSIYFREPSGVLFEITTIGPGFTADEPLEYLGERLSLPPAFEHLRPELEKTLTPLPSPRQAVQEVTLSGPALTDLEFRLRESDGDPQGALVLFHGRGTDEHDLYPLLDVLDPEPRLLGVTPRGPLSLPAGGAYWYVVQRVGYPDPETFNAVYPRTTRWLDALAEERGIAPERTVLGGFSQGAVMAHALGLGGDRPRPAAIVALSGFVPTVPGWEPDLERPLPPVAIGHGTYDPVIPVEFGRRAREILEEAGADVVYRESPLPHTVDPAFLGELVPWIRDALAKAPSRA